MSIKVTVGNGAFFRPGKGFGRISTRKSGLEEQTHLVMNHLHEILKAGGMRFSDVVKSVLYLENMDDFQQVNAIYAKYFDEGYAPVRETVAVKKLPKGAKVEISMIAVDSD